MALTPAERARRYRERQRAVKSGGQPVSTPAGSDVTSRVTVTNDRDAVTLAPAGRQLWDELDGDGAVGGQRVLIVEACRIADRLDKLDDFLRGHEDTWMRFHSRTEDGSIVEVVVDKSLSEARQQATALKQIIGELRQTAPTGKPARRGQGGQARTSGTGAQPAPVKEGGGVVADLAAWVANRGTASAG